MPAEHRESFRVRYYECDAFGHMNNANYLRWMQEAAFAASAAAGYDFSTYERMGFLWLVRESTIEYIRPLMFGVEVTVRTWVEDIRRFRSLRRYEFLLPNGKIAARGSTDWVYVDAATLRPAEIPEPMRRAFRPEGDTGSGTERARFPEPPPPPAGIFRARRRVEWRDLDPMWHVNNAVYLAYVEEAGTGVCAAHGWPMTRLQAEGFAMVVSRHRIEYRLPAKFGDELEVGTWFTDDGKATATRYYTIRRVPDQELLSRVATLWVWVDTKNGRPVRIPVHFIADFSDNRAAPEEKPDGLRFDLPLQTGG